MIENEFIVSLQKELMTLLAAWVGVDCQKNGPEIASIYIATDSRISWGSASKFDMGKKIFGMNHHPDIFGYCGDVLFPTIAIQNIVAQADAGILYSEGMMPDQKYELVLKAICTSIDQYPKERIVRSFEIIYATRYKQKDFYCYRIAWNNKDGFHKENGRITLPRTSTVIATAGSGSPEFTERFESEYNRSEHNDYRTSRAVYQCFTDCLDEIKDPACGGAPQIVGLYRKDNARFFGIIREGKRYFLGNVVDYSENLNFVQWRNDNFERCDPKDTQILELAQRQPKSKVATPLGSTK